MSGADRELLARALRAHLEDLQAFGVEEVPGGPWPEAAGAELPAAGEGAEPFPAAPEPAAAGAALERVATEIAACTRCSLCETRTQTVPGQGAPGARLMFVGEAPGADEDRQGLAFVGRAGQLLTRMIAAMGFEREEVFIANVLKCRPPRNRDPEPGEVLKCRPFLERQIALIRPEVVVALGAHAARNLLGVGPTVGVGRLRGKAHPYAGTRVVVTYHPAYLLRSPQMKRTAWQDLKLALGVLGLEPPPPAGGS